MKNKIDLCFGFDVTAGGANCGTNDIHDACNTYTCESGTGTAVCSAPAAQTSISCNDNDASTNPDACNAGQCDGTGKKYVLHLELNI